MRGTSTHFYQALNRPFHILGVDRSLFYLFVALCLPLAFANRLSIKMDLVAIGLFVIFYTIGVLITRADNQIILVYRRHIHYKKYYAPQAGIHAAVSLLKPSVPFYEGKRGLV